MAKSRFISLTSRLPGPTANPPHDSNRRQLFYAVSAVKLVDVAASIERVNKFYRCAESDARSRYWRRNLTLPLAF